MAMARAISMNGKTAPVTKEAEKLTPEEKAARVKVSASKKVSKALSTISALAKLSKKLTTDQQDKVLSALESTCESLASEYEASRNGVKVKQETFTL